MIKLFDIKDFRYVILIAIAMYGMHLYKENNRLKIDNNRISENYKQQSRLDSLNYAQKILDKKEIEDYLNFQNTELKSQLRSQGIKLRRIEKLIVQKHVFKDTIKKVKSISPIIASIQENKPDSISFKESGKCFSIGGKVVYDGKDSLGVHITNREYKNNYSYTGTWERKPHRWLFGIKTRLFGKKVSKVTINSDCGETETLIIDKKKK